MRIQFPLCELEGTLVRLADDCLLQCDASLGSASDLAPHTFQRGSKPALSQPRQFEVRSKPEVVIGEEQWRLAVLLISAIGQIRAAVLRR